MSKWCGNENCLLCVDNEPDPYVRLLREDYDALRAENARLREALATIARYGKDGICPYGCDTPYIAQAALQPKEAQP